MNEYRGIYRNIRFLFFVGRNVNLHPVMFVFIYFLFCFFLFCPTLGIFQSVCSQSHICVPFYYLYFISECSVAAFLNSHALILIGIYKLFDCQFQMCFWSWIYTLQKGRSPDFTPLIYIILYWSWSICFSVHFLRDKYYVQVVLHKEVGQCVSRTVVYWNKHF